MHADDKRADTRQAAGFLALKRHIPLVTDSTDEEWIELKQIVTDSSTRLCQEAGLTYSWQEIVGFNQGVDAGQTVFHAHVHIFPIAKEDPPQMKGRVGMSAAFEALYREKMRD